MKKISYIISLAFLLLFSACEVDTYDLPQETLKGTLTDAQGNPYISEEPNGFKIRMIEEGSTQPRDFWGMPDGAFQNTKIFKGEYRILPIDGAFFPVDTLKAEIKGITTIDFKVTPYVTINSSIVADGLNLKAIYSIKKAVGAGKIQNARLLVSKWNPNVGMNYIDKSIMRDLSKVSDVTIAETEYTDQITGYLESGVTYYARVAVLATNPIGRYNLSPVVKIVVP